MKRTKMQKGITLIALIITIIILLILAVVTIGSIKNSNIITYAQNASADYTAKKDEEESKISGYESLIDSNLPVELREPISKTKSFVGCYADVDGNGTVDGIIYADLAIGGSGQWGNEDGAYEIPIKQNLNNYYISKENHQESGFGENAVISPINKVEENDRFYVMALEDFITEEYKVFCWYEFADGKMNPSDTKVEFGEGRTNTKTIIEIWNKNGATGGYEGATQGKQDIWKYIPAKVTEGWFIPSRGEWGAFGTFITGQGLTSSNCLEYGLNKTSYGTYFSSSQDTENYIWSVSFSNGFMYDVQALGAQRCTFKYNILKQ